MTKRRLVGAPHGPGVPTHKKHSPATLAAVSATPAPSVHVPATYAHRERASVPVRPSVFKKGGR